MRAPSAFLLSLLARSALSAQAPVPMHEEPRHRLVWSSERFRLMDVRIPPGDTTLFHVHDRPTLYVAISISPTDAQPLGGAWNGVATTGTRRAPGDVNSDTSYYDSPATHRVTNVGTSPFRLIGIASSAPPSRSARPASELPGVPGISSGWFRQTRLDAGAAADTGWHRTTLPIVVVQPLDGVAAVRFESGEERALREAGAWTVIPPNTRYRLERRGGSSMLVLIQVL